MHAVNQLTSRARTCTHAPGAHTGALAHPLHPLCACTQARQTQEILQQQQQQLLHGVQPGSAAGSKTSAGVCHWCHVCHVCHVCHGRAAAQKPSCTSMNKHVDHASTWAASGVRAPRLCLLSCFHSFAFERLCSIIDTGVKSRQSCVLWFK